MIVKRLIHIKTIPKLYCNNIESLKNPNNLPTHELLTKLNFINHPKSGLVNWLPIGLLIINKLKKVINKRMNEINFEELNLSLLSSSSLWKKTGRWNNNELFKLRDSSNNEYCLVATAEEEITNLLANNVNSYKNFPILYYQINTKFRDEKRPRSGLLRGKEFIMKDGYSFDLNKQNAMVTYDNVMKAYTNIFNDLRLPFIKADADTGAIGGSLSHEWHYLHHTGEDTLFSCNSCGNVSNIEKTLSYSEDVEDQKNVSVNYFTTNDRSTLVCAYYPSNRTLHPNFIKNEIPDIDLGFTDEKEILNKFSDEDTLIFKKIIRIMDSRLTSRSHFPDFPIKFINRSLITTLTDIPIVLAVENEICGACEEGKLVANKAIEIGHTFYLDDKYTKPLNCTIEVPDGNGKIEKRNLIMGCYGIGLSRIIAAIGEINKDEKGLNWPSMISPWDITIIESPTIKESPSKFYELLNNENIDYRLDNRLKIGLGKKINQSNLIGIPLSVIVGKNFPIIEIETRGKRYSNDLEWKKLYESKDFEWDVKFGDNGDDIKHFVHLNGIIRVIKALLKDM